MSKFIFAKFLKLSVLSSMTLISFIADSYLQDMDLGRVTTSFLAVSILYFLFRFVLEIGLRKTIDYSRTRYSLRKLLVTFFYAAAGLALVTIWLESTESLIVTYGLFSAGVALALQESLKNFFGGLTVYMSGLYQVGDRVEINGTAGDVLDVDFLYTTLMEIQNWIDGDQPTGRIVYIPNQKISVENVTNYTKDHQFIWDEIVLPLTYDSDWNRARELILMYLSEELAEELETAEKDLETLGRNYYLEQKTVNPAVYITVTDNWIELHIRYICHTASRRDTANTVHKKLIDIVNNEPNIKLGTESYRVYGSEARD
jgi:small-conductance mechanosensitive channel